MPFRQRFYKLLTTDTLRGERVVLAMLSLAWGLYLISPLAPTNFLNVAGGMMFIFYSFGIVFDILTSDTVKVIEGFYGCCLWVIGAAYQVKYEMDDTIFLIAVPVILSWWVLANALARLKSEVE